ncbi:MAG: DNA polymerase I [bacterium]
MKRGTIYIIDAHGFLHRSYHALPRLTSSKGEEVGALFGFARMLLKLRKEKTPEYAAVCFDSPGENFRHRLYGGYKSNRKETDAGLKTQLALAKDLAGAMGFRVLAAGGMEADDIMAALAGEAGRNGFEAVIVTSDKDMLQLVGEMVKVWDGKSPAFTGAEQVREKYGLSPDKLADYFALTGDASDNIPGVKGIGPKSALKLICAYGSLDGVLKAAENGGSMDPGTAEKIREGSDAARISGKLVTLDASSEPGVAIKDCRLSDIAGETLGKLASRLEFRELMEIAAVPAVSSAGAEPLPETEWTALLKTGHVSPGGVFMASGSDPEGRAWVCLSTDGKKAAVKEISVLSQAEKDKLRLLLCDQAVKKTGPDLKALLKKCGFTGFEPRNFTDIGLAAYCLNPSAPASGARLPAVGQVQQSSVSDRTRKEDIRSSDGAGALRPGHGFQRLAAEYLGMFLPKMPVPDALRLEAAVSENLASAIAGKMKELGVEEVYYSLEEPLAPVLADMETAGVKVDTDRLTKLGKALERKMIALHAEVNEMAGSAVNLNSPKQLAFLLFEKFRLPHGRKTKTGFSTNEEVLLSLAAAHPAVAKILEYREAAKLKSSFVDNLVEMADHATGRLHTYFDQTGTATGRLSSSKPNLQNIPVRSEQGREIRKAFIPEHGFVLLSGDYSQIDLKVLAHVSGDVTLAEAFSKGEDIHLKTACEVFGIRPDKADAETRRRAKAINFGIVYGQTASGLAKELGIPREEAAHYIEHYFKVYSGVAGWIKKTLAEAGEKGFVRTLSGRIRFLPELKASNGNIRAFGERAAVNSPIQGGSADIIKKAMIGIHRAIISGRSPSGVRMILQVHDELIFEVPESEVNSAAAFIKREMEHAWKLSVPLKVDIKAGKNWQDMESVRIQ